MEMNKKQIVEYPPDQKSIELDEQVQHARCQKPRVMHQQQPNHTHLAL